MRSVQQTMPEAVCTHGPAKWAAVVVLLTAWTALGLVWHSRSAPEGAFRGSAAHRVSLNEAGAEELELLPGIGPALADRIIEDRAANGPYAGVNELARVRGIGPRIVERVQRFVRVD
ncbi:MAG: helix-hairpin-helix domain-containing protein [Phycisphaeraceae bacterium]|nr:helix-hairpin-helix domain-containing protein [Phycisphaeraceae bacterium]MCW5754152.1 helix-hairpin-helix domain-containing protein [Phycisphaeraceae bacterium]